MAKKKKQELKKVMNNANVKGLHAEVLEQPITETLEINYMPYAMSVIISRAIPEIDGFKPSHRKLLYTMYQMHLLNGNRTKSANVVGATMKLNPHGDAAIYDTMVRLSKGYNALLHPPVDSKGNFGKVYSRDMAWAASRYTEVKLSSICQEFFKDIDKNTVDFQDNYDGTVKEPVLLPTTFPNVLVASNQGIAVGMASNVCGFNLSEVCDAAIELMRNENADIFEIIKAPDFTTGGQLLYEQEAMEQVLTTGKGSIKVRGKWRYIKAENLIEIYEIPYSTTVEAIIDKVTELVRSGKVREISDIRDETDLTGLKIAIDLKRGVDPEKLMSKLYSVTSLQDAYACNFNILIKGEPKVMGVREILSYWIEWRMECVKRRVQFDLERKNEKLHLLTGLRAILLDIDKAIEIIRGTELDSDVIPNLMIGFGIDELQADYVAEIKLRNINKEYILKRISEIKELERDISDLCDIIEKPQRIKRIIASELREVKRRYSEERHTEIIYDFEEYSGNDSEEIADYDVNIFVTKEGYLKKITPRSLQMSSEQKYKENDELKQTFFASNRSEIIFFTDKQMCYKAYLRDFSDTKASVLGEFIPSKLGFDESENLIYTCIPSEYEGHILFFYENGKVAKVPLDKYQTLTKRKRLTSAYSDKSKLVSCIVTREEADIAIFTTDNRAVIFNSGDISAKTTRNTQGVNVVTLKAKQCISGASLLSETQIVNISRYKPKTLPATGAILKPDDAGITQLTL